MSVNLNISNSSASGKTSFVADGVLNFVDIVHNTNQFEPEFTLSTLTPITLNHLNRTITYPDNNTIRITFTNPPIIGEDTIYVWIVPKNQNL
jgi:hypothetical protein